MSFYSFDIEDIINKQLPTRKKGATHLEWLYALLKPVKTAHDNFISFRDTSRVELSYNSQTKIFEKLLNDFVDPTQRRIYIDNLFDNKERVYLFNKGEFEPVYLYDISEGQAPAYIYSTPEYAQDYDFIIYVPTALTSEENRIRALADRTKIAGTRYTINYY